MFEINYDLEYIKYKNKHNWVHMFGSALLVILFVYLGMNKAPAFFLAWGLGILWEVGDGFKPWFYKFKRNPTQSKFTNMLRESLLYSDKFSLQDIFFWDLIGCIIGVFL